MRHLYFRNIKRRVFSITLSLSLLSSCFSVIPVKAEEVNSNSVEDQMKTLLKEELSKNSGSEQASTVSDETNSKDPEEVVKLLVQLNGESAVEKTEDLESAINEEQDVKNSQEDIIKTIQNITGSNAQNTYGYLVNGFSIKGKRKYIEEIEKVDGVKSVSESAKMKSKMATSNVTTQAQEVWNNYSYKGQGMLVSIIDTGVDYSHKDFKETDTSNLKISKSDADKEIKELGYGKYYSDKIPFGYNYADENNEVKNEDYDHGTHVSGIVAANGTVKGVAPEAQILAMRVASDDGGFYTEDILRALEDSVKLGADIINMSFGSDAIYSGSENLFREAIENAIGKGVVCVNACGNSQTSTSRDSSLEPSNALGIKDTSAVDVPSQELFSVASVENIENNNQNKYVKLEDTSGILGEYQFTSVDGSDLSTLTDKYKFVYCKLGTENDFQNVDVNGKVAVIDRGTNTFDEKYSNAVKKGAKAVIIVNNENGYIYMAVTKQITVPILFISNKDGQKIIEEINKGNNEFTIQEGDGSTIKDEQKSSQISNFTSWGPSPDLELKPEITAPGGNIYSTVNDDGYAVNSGTSMASPNVAGGSALVIQALKEKGIESKNKVELVKTLMMNTAKPVINTDTSIPYSPRQQGAGLMQIEDAINNSVTVTDSRGKASLALKNVGNETTFEMNLTNYGNEDVTYTLSNDGKVYTENCSEQKISEVELEGATIKFDKTLVKVKANSTEKVTGTLSISDSFEKQNFAEGFITFSSNSKDIPNLSIPFLAFYGDYGDEKILDSPSYEQDSLMKTTGLGQYSEDGSFTYYGAQNSTASLKNTIEVDKDKVAFSPNGDNTKDYVDTRTYCLRNAKSVKAEVLDENKNLIGNTKIIYDAVKDIYVNYIKEQVNGLNNIKYSWDGTCYDSTTGENKTVKDGKYYIRLTATGYTEAAKGQILDMPIKVDTKQPQVKINNVSYTKSFGRKACTISWTASDDASGIQKAATVVFDNDSSTVQTLSNIKEQNGVYTANALVGSVQPTSIKLSMSDGAGNIGIGTSGDIEESDIKNTDKTAPVITGISDYKEDSVNISTSEAIRFTVNGEDESAVSCIVKNMTTGKSNSWNMNSNGQASAEVYLAEGVNLISVGLVDEAGNYSDYKYFSVVRITDTSKLSAGFTNIQNIIEINSEETKDNIFTLKGYVTAVPKKITLNGEDITVNNDLTFTKDIELNQGVNKLKLYIEDKSGQVLEETIYKVYYDGEAPKIKLSSTLTPSSEGYIKTDKDEITISGSVTDSASDYYLLINGNEEVSTAIEGLGNEEILARDFSKTIALNEEKNVIKVQAVDLYGNTTTQNITVMKGDIIENNTDKQDSSDIKEDEDKSSTEVKKEEDSETAKDGQSSESDISKDKTSESDTNESKDTGEIPNTDDTQDKDESVKKDETNVQSGDINGMLPLAVGTLAGFTIILTIKRKKQI